MQVPNGPTDGAGPAQALNATPSTSKPPAHIPTALRSLGRESSQGPDSWVFRKGDPVRAVFLVLDGEVRLCRFAANGSEVVLHRAIAGEFFAEAALSTLRYHCNAIVSRPTRLLAFPAARVRVLLARDAAFAQGWMELLARQLHAARARLERLALKSAADRVLHYLHTEGEGTHCEITLRGTVKDLARELGLAHESLYRTLATLERQGVVHRAEGRISLG
jgi:CRP-like cAMP-binding protein